MKHLPEAGLADQLDDAVAERRAGLTALGDDAGGLADLHAGRR